MEITVWPEEQEKWGAVGAQVHSFKWGVWVHFTNE